jgi:hypothetical protein
MTSARAGPQAMNQTADVAIRDAAPSPPAKLQAPQVQFRL